ncbi:threonine transporter RhtB [Paludifilum halophilum]|uniref:Threonine transporter RhtB n=2 Tax=Paludifilum halophilum TaxID=1642702 RepID=A0A235B7A0_9BACL|nr:threonine transporter RhtB [Paludifilum halophilum]
MPGPDILFVIAQSVSQGRKAGIATAMGLCSGITVHTTAAAVGISAVLHQSAFAFQMVKYAGACYLLYLAWKALKEDDGGLSGRAIPRRNLKSLYKKGILMNVLNPKVSLFFLALLPQFVSPGAGRIPLQMVLLGLIFMIQAFAVFSVVSILAGILSEKIRAYSNLGRYVNKVKAGIFLLLGIRLALSEGSSGM